MCNNLFQTSLIVILTIGLSHAGPSNTTIITNAKSIGNIQAIGIGDPHCGDIENPCIISRDMPEVITNEGENYNYRKIYRFPKLNNYDECQVRLDFDLMELSKPDLHGDCSGDSLQVVGCDLNGLTICGNNTGQHIYVNVNRSDSFDLHIRIQSSNSRYIIRPTFLNCYYVHENIAPPHCLQYYTSVEGTVKSFGFERHGCYEEPCPPTSNGTQSNNLDYSVCIKPAEGMNKIQWKECDNTANPFFLTGSTMDLMPMEGEKCMTDWVQIYGGNRYCGKGFRPMTSTSKPFLLNARMDDREGDPGYPSYDPNQDNGNTGFCLQYIQLL